MLNGIQLKANPTSHQRLILSQWMGCAKTIWNAKCEDERYMTRFARRFCPIGTYAPIDTKFSQYKDEELTPWLYECPSQILRNSATNWYQTYRKFIKGECGKPKRKKRGHQGSIYLTREVFKFEQCSDGNVRLFIGTKKNNIGYLSFKKHKSFKEPKSLYITKKYGTYWISFCYEMDEAVDIPTKKQTLKHLKGASLEYLHQYTVGIDRGVAVPIQSGNESFDFSLQQKKNKEKHDRSIKRLQRQVARRLKGSNRLKKTRQRISKKHAQIANIRKDFCHQSSRRIINNKNYKIIVLEDLKTKNMSGRSKPKPNARGGWDKNNAKAKSGLNRSILDKGWHRFETFLNYKAERAGKVMFKVSAAYTSQACPACGHTHPNNRPSRSEFVCENCGHSDHADRNAAINIKQQAIKLITHSGTELSKRGVLTSSLDTGQGAKHKSGSAKVLPAVGCELSKKKRKTSISIAV